MVLLFHIFFISIISIIYTYIYIYIAGDDFSPNLEILQVSNLSAIRLDMYYIDIWKVMRPKNVTDLKRYVQYRTRPYFRH